MSLDLSPFAARVHAAVTTNQCLDYAADVQQLIHEVTRLQDGYAAMIEAQDEAYKKAVVGVGITFSAMREAGHIHRGMTRAIEAFDAGAR